jgi:SAM-dependent methyltransferase
MFKRRRKVGLAMVIVGLLALVFSSSAVAQDKEPDVIYVPTPDTVVKKMLEMANVEKGDYVIDLGSGYGRVVIQAAEQGAYAHGVEIDPERLREARQNADESGVQDRVAFLKGDLFEADFSRASAITLYLLRSLNIKLRPKLIDKLDPGTPIVSHSFDMGEWQPDQYTEIEGDEIYLWYVPADVKGSWQWTADGKSVSIQLDQKFQKIDVNMQSSNPDFTIRDATLKGKRLSFIAGNQDVRHVYSGEVVGDSIKGVVQIHEDGEKSVESWNATRE